MADQIAKLGIEVDATGAIRQVQQFGDASERTAKQTTVLESTAGKLRAAYGSLAGVLLGGSVFAKTVQETVAAQDAQAQLENAVRATGGAAGWTAVELANMASALQLVTRFGDDAIQGAMTRLLSYTSIQGTTYTRATEAVLDFATAYRMDLVQAAELVGRALEYPARATEALSRQGFRFSGAQQEMLEQLVKTGRVAEAQAIILNSLQEATEGAARAARDTLGGALAGLRNDFGDLFEIGREDSGQLIAYINGLSAAVRGLGDNLGTVATVATMAGGVMGARYVASLIEANRATITMREQVLRGNAVMLDSAAAERGRTAATVERAREQVGASRAAVRALEQERAAIRQLQIAERQRLAESTARVRRAVPEARLAPLGGAVVMRDNAQVVLAMREQERAQASLNQLGTRAAAVDAQLATTRGALRTQTLGAAAANLRMAAVLTQTSVASRIAATAAAQLGAVMNALGGPIGIAIMGAMALNALVDSYLNKKLEAAEISPEEEAAFQRAMATMRARRAAQQRQQEEDVEEAKRRAKELRDVINAGVLNRMGAQREFDAVGLEGVALEKYNLATQKLLDLERARQSLSGEALRRARLEIENTYILRDATIERADALKREEERLRALVQADRDVMAAQLAREQERREALEAPFRNAMENIQRSWGDLFTRIFEMGRVTAGDVADLFRRAAAEMVVATTMARARGALAGVFGLGLGGEDSSLGGQMNREALQGLLAGGLVGYGFGRATQSGTGGFITGGLGGAGIAAMMGAGPLGMAVGGLSGALSGLIGGLTGAAERTREWQRALRDLEANIAMFNAQTAGDTAEQQRLAAKQWADQARRQLDDQFGAVLYWVNKGMGENSDQYREYLRLLDEINRAERDRLEAIGREATAVRDLNGQLLNLESGYKLARAVFQAMDPLASRPRGPADPPIPSTWQPGQANEQSVVLMLDGEKVGTGIIRGLQRRAAATFGDGARWPELVVT